MMLTLLARLVRLRQQGRGDGLVLQTDTFLLRGPPLHKLNLGLQFRLLRLYVPQRASLVRRLSRPALQLLDLGEGDRRAARGLPRDGLCGR
jgi:hypothetical protein